MRSLVLAGGLLFLLSSCGLGPQGTDTKADTELGVIEDEEQASAEETLAGIQEYQLRERKKQLEREISDPLV